MNLKRLGKFLEKKRIAMGYPRDALAEKSGIHRNTIWNVERGTLEDIKFSTIEKYAAVFKMPVAKLVELLQRGVGRVKVVPKKKKGTARFEGMF